MFFSNKLHLHKSAHSRNQGTLCKSCHFKAEDFIGIFIPSTFKFAMELFLGKRKMILAAYGMSFVSGVVTDVKITTLACSLQPNKKIKADKRLINQPYA